MIYLKQALIKAKGLINYYIQTAGEGYSQEEIQSIKHFLNGLRAGCECDNYNGFDCGCTERAFLSDEAIKELEQEEVKS